MQHPEENMSILNILKTMIKRLFFARFRSKHTEFMYQEEDMMPLIRNSYHGWEENNENRSLLTNTIIRFKLANGEEIRLKIDVSASSLFYYAQFELNPDIEKMLALGIKKIAINTIPEAYFYDGDETVEFSKLLSTDFDKVKDLPKLLDKEKRNISLDRNRVKYKSLPVGVIRI